MSRKTLQKFWEDHPDSETALTQWFKTALAADWRNLADVRRIYPHADAARTKKSGILTVFNVGGNKYRLIARIRFDWQLVNVRAVLTHREYDQGSCKE